MKTLRSWEGGERRVESEQRGAWWGAGGAHVMAWMVLLVWAGFSSCQVCAQPSPVAIATTNSVRLDRNRAYVPLRLSRPPSEFHARVKENGAWKDVPSALSYSVGGTNLQIEPNKLYCVAQRGPAPATGPGERSKGRLLASSLLIMGRTNGAAASHTEIVSGTIFISCVEEPVPWDTKTKSYQTQLKVGFDSTNSAHALQQFFPLGVQLIGANVHLEPDKVSITNAGPDGYQTAEVRTPTYSEDAAVTAHYVGADERCPLHFKKLGFLGMINLLFPASFLFATIAGGCIGGALRLLKLRRKHRGAWYWLVPEGVLVGIVFVAALTAGLGGASGNLSPSMVGSEIGAFAIAALSSFVGTAALDYFTKNLFGIGAGAVGAGERLRAEG